MPQTVQQDSTLEPKIKKKGELQQVALRAGRGMANQLGRGGL